jgi:hypothetical protein
MSTRWTSRTRGLFYFLEKRSGVELRVFFGRKMSQPPTPRRFCSKK